MHTYNVIAAIFMASTVFAGLPGLSRRAPSCNENEVACGNSCMSKDTGEVCCNDADDTQCPPSTVCTPMEAGVSCQKGGPEPQLGQHGDASCLEPQLPCGSNTCFQPVLSSTCCTDGTVCYNKGKCVPDNDIGGGKIKCCDPTTEECGAAPVANATTSVKISLPTVTSTSTTELPTASTTALPVFSTSVAVSVNSSCSTITTVVPKSTSVLPIILPTVVPTLPITCDKFAPEDLKLLADTVTVLADVLAKLGYCNAHPNCTQA
ncbi:MAG: hypothetical protein M1816_005018 [Peltula sp. TS41687]|nr:MAG: hypothetical protein M1816_005018 [Peltula sp. TS41687]